MTAAFKAFTGFSKLSSLFSKMNTKLASYPRLKIGLTAIPFFAVPYAGMHLLPLPEEFDSNIVYYPALVRLRIFRAARETDIDEAVVLLEAALEKILRNGYGYISPQATNLTLYICQRYLKEPETPVNQLFDCFCRLIEKPHVGKFIG
jgi:hypothetical protein